MEGTENRPDITPDTKVAELLRHYPELEDVLVSMSEEFRRLKNPVLRRTVARVATLRQVARIGGVSLGDLINTLRREAGLVETNVAETDMESASRPEWWKEPVKSFDAREMIENGGHPLGLVMQDLAALADGDVYELVTPFVPEPLLEVARGKGYLVWTAPQEEPNLVRNYFTRAATKP